MKAFTICLDLAKTFDIVNHVELIRINLSFSLKTNCLMWFKSYLSKGIWILMMNGVFGQKREIVCGVPQGSVLGPIIFMIYLNSIAIYKIDG